MPRAFQRIMVRPCLSAAILHFFARRSGVTLAAVLLTLTLAQDETLMGLHATFTYIYGDSADPGFIFEQNAVSRAGNADLQVVHGKDSATRA